MKALLIALVLLVSTPAVRAQTLFYRGKTIKIVVGFVPGAYDQWARMIARQMGKHIPGNPDFIIQNMPGAGGMTASNYVYSVAKPDGLTLGALGPAQYFDQLTGRKEVKFDWSKFSWIGNPEQSEFIFIIRADTPYKSVEDIRNATEPPKCGASGTGTSGYYMLKLFEETLGLKFNIVSGYQGGNEIDVAIERGEVQCRNLTLGTFYGRELSDSWRKKGFIRSLIQTAKKRDPRAREVPTIFELMEQYKTPEVKRRLATVILAPAVFGRPMVATPGIPADRVKILRDAYNKALKEPELLEEARKNNWVIEPISGEELASLAKEVIAQPPEVIEQMKNVLGQ